MIHDIDILITLIKSDIKYINASGVSVLSKTIDMANTRIEFENGCVANMTASRISQKKLRKFRVFEPKSYTNIDFLNPCVETYVLSKDQPKNDCSYLVINENEEKYILYDKPKIDLHNALRVELMDFVKSIKLQQKPTVDGSDGLRALEIAIKIRNQIKNKNS
jgi:predicted dehydrogenase